jgi:dihydrofolate reductase
VIGGEAIFKAALPMATHLYLTEIHQDFSGDTYFPSYDHSVWKEISRERASEGDLQFDFVIYENSARSVTRV